jgi:hypothetical protein
VKIAIDTGRGEIFDIVTAAVTLGMIVQRGARRAANHPDVDDSIRKR